MSYFHSISIEPRHTIKTKAWKKIKVNDMGPLNTFKEFNKLNVWISVSFATCCDC